MVQSFGQYGLDRRRNGPRACWARFRIGRTRAAHVGGMEYRNQLHVIWHFALDAPRSQRGRGRRFPRAL